jgi:hypothetical protein
MQTVQWGHSKPTKSSSESQSNEWSTFIISSGTSLSSFSEVDSSSSSISGVEVSPKIFWNPFYMQVTVTA